MWKWLVFAVGLTGSGVASASSRAGCYAPTAPEFSGEMPADFPLTAAAEAMGKGKNPVDAIKEDIEEKKDEREKAAEERMAAFEAAQGQRVSRVVVLEWPNSDTDYRNEALIRNIKTRIARQDAKFYPDIDLYQAGRREPDRQVRPEDQRAVVPDSAIARINQVVEEVATIPWNALSEQDWGLKASDLRQIANEIWFIDRPELREPLFLLFTQIGRAAENKNDTSPPLYENVAERSVNYYWYLAATMAHDEPALMAKLTDQDINQSVGYYKDLLDQGVFPPMTLSFDIEGDFDAKAFAGEFEVFINGLPQQVNDLKGLHQVVPGRVDVYLSRSDGHSLSDKIELQNLQDKIYFVRKVAREKMGVDFIDQLMEHPYECTPDVDGDILTYLSIYAKLHGQAEIYIAVPRYGSIAPRNIFLWRWDRPRSVLMRVEPDDGGFPVRFVALVGAGITFNGASYKPPTDQELTQAAASGQPDNPTGGLDAVGGLLGGTPDLKPSAFPIYYHLRAHYGRLMFGTGIDFAANLVPGETWQDLYQTEGQKYSNGDAKEDGQDVPATNTHLLTEQIPIEFDKPTGADCPVGSTENAGGRCEASRTQPVFRERTWQRLVHFDLGVVLGRNAAIGFGPRGYIRTGWYNAPHAVDMTGHVGLAAPPPFIGKENGRVRPIVDLDFFGGMMIPFRDSIFVEAGRKIGKPLPTFGTMASAGITF